MLISNSLVAEADRFREMKDGEQVLDALQECFRGMGATHFLATGLPLPGRPIEPLLLRVDWGEWRGRALRTGTFDPDDPVLRLALRSRRAFFCFERREHERTPDESPLVRSVGPLKQVRFIGVPVHGFPPYQACVIGAGVGLERDRKQMLALDYYCAEAFRRLIELSVVRLGRPGDLSGRERKVVELSATGKTASEIADLLKISQRTVHAHLQNASSKLRATNKTHTVVEALRYGQISV